MLRYSEFMLKSKLLAGFGEVVYGVSEVADGNMSVNWGDTVTVDCNRRKFLGKLGIKQEDCVIASLELGTRIVEVGSSQKDKYVEGDALVMKEEGVGLFMLTADCHATVVYDPVKKILVLVHLGRQGLDRELPEKVIKEMESLGSRAGNVIAAAGPGISRESYVWEGDLPFAHPGWTEFVERGTDGKWRIDMAGFLRRQFFEAGVREKNIEISSVDVYSDSRFYSHVRSVKTGEAEGRFATVVMIRKSLG